VSRCVLDSSALLASFYGEAGADRIDEILRDSVISMVNAAEVISKLVERGMPAGGQLAVVAEFDCNAPVLPAFRRAAGFTF